MNDQQQAFPLLDLSLTLAAALFVLAIVAGWVR